MDAVQPLHARSHELTLLKRAAVTGVPMGSLDDAFCFSSPPRCSAEPLCTRCRVAFCRMKASVASCDRAGTPIRLAFLAALPVWLHDEIRRA